MAVDSSGKLPSGESFRGPGELKAILKAHKSEFARCLTEKMLTYALGRGMEEYDHCAVEQIVKSLESSRYRFYVLLCSQSSKATHFRNGALMIGRHERANVS